MNEWTINHSFYHSIRKSFSSLIDWLVFLCMIPNIVNFINILNIIYLWINHGGKITCVLPQQIANYQKKKFFIIILNFMHIKKKKCSSRTIVRGNNHVQKVPKHNLTSALVIFDSSRIFPPLTWNNKIRWVFCNNIYSFFFPQSIKLLFGIQVWWF